MARKKEDLDSWSYLMGRVDGEKEIIRMAHEVYEPKQCKHCGSKHVVKFGHSKHLQRLLCRDCGHTFVDSDALPGMKVSPAVVASLLTDSMKVVAFYQKGLQQDYGIYPSDSTVYEWIRRYTKIAVAQASTLKPQVGEVFQTKQSSTRILVAKRSVSG